MLRDMFIFLFLIQIYSHFISWATGHIHKSISDMYVVSHPEDEWIFACNFYTREYRI